MIKKSDFATIKFMELDLNKVYEFLKKCGTYYLATIDGDSPRVRPFGTVDLFEGRLYIQSGKKKDVAKQILKNTKVELCAFMDGRWLRVRGTLKEDNRFEARKHMLDNYPELRKMYDENDDNTIVWYFINGDAELSSFGKQTKNFKF